MDSIETIELKVEIQANGIIRNEKGRLIGRLVDDVDFESEHVKGLLVNPNNIKVGDVIEVQQAWEDESGAYHDEFPTVLEIKENGELKLDFGNKEIDDFLEGAEFFAKDYKPEKDE